VDFQEQEVPGSKKDGRSERNLPGHNSSARAQTAAVPNEDELKRVAEILNVGQRVAILAGRGALNAGAELEQVAERLAAPVAKALLGKACLPDDKTYTTATMGLLGTQPSLEVMSNCDTLLIVGSSFPYIEFLPKPTDARGVQIDRDPSRVGLHFPVEVGLVGDCKQILSTLTPFLQHKKSRKFLEGAQKGTSRWRERMEKHETVTTTPIKPQLLAAELGNDAIISCDSGSITVWWARHVQVKKGQLHSVSRNLASIACALT
jgi:pyruvate dehydrogenase (quinone)/pyruvate oxidase